MLKYYEGMVYPVANWIFVDLPPKKSKIVNEILAGAGGIQQERSQQTFWESVKGYITKMNWNREQLGDKWPKHFTGDFLRTAAEYHLHKHMPNRMEIGFSPNFMMPDSWHLDQTVFGSEEAVNDVFSYLVSNLKPISAMYMFSTRENCYKDRGENCLVYYSNSLEYAGVAKAVSQKIILISEDNSADIDLTNIKANDNNISKAVSDGLSKILIKKY